MLCPTGHGKEGKKHCCDETAQPTPSSPVVEGRECHTVWRTWGSDIAIPLMNIRSRLDVPDTLPETSVLSDLSPRVADVSGCIEETVSQPSLSTDAPAEGANTNGRNRVRIARPGFPVVGSNRGARPSVLGSVPIGSQERRGIAFTFT